MDVASPRIRALFATLVIAAVALFVLARGDEPESAADPPATARSDGPSGAIDARPSAPFESDPVSPPADQSVDDAFFSLFPEDDSAWAWSRVDLDALWTDLGVKLDGFRVIYNDDAPMAHVRKHLLKT